MEVKKKSDIEIKPEEEERGLWLGEQGEEEERQL